MTVSIRAQVDRIFEAPGLYVLSGEDSLEQRREERVREEIERGSNVEGQVTTIPIVYHILHQNGVENISASQVLSQMDVLNLDFRRLNADTVNTNPIFTSVAADMEIEFCLATKDSQGNSTTGIVRHFQLDTLLSKPQIVQMYGWDNKKYMNIYVGRFNSGALSSFPWEPDSIDGILIDHTRVGTMGTAGNGFTVGFARFGRTATHEIGHYLGLYHTFHGGCSGACATSGDFVCDTPPVDMRWWISTCLGQSMNTCGSSGTPDQVDNFMDYNIDSCANMFTLGQKARVEAMLAMYRSELWSAANLTDVGCSSAVGISENYDDDVSLSPNPLKDMATLSFENTAGESFTFVLYNMQGQLVREVSGITSNELQINRNGLQAGIYFLRLEGAAGIRYRGRLVVVD